MQRQLTQEEAERCARACGCELVEHQYTRDQGYRIKGAGDVAWYDLSTNPHFWRPKLEDRLDEIEPGLVVYAIEMADRNWYWFVARRVSGFPDTLEDSFIARSESRCLALCEAIEKLQNEAPGAATPAGEEGK